MSARLGSAWLGVPAGPIAGAEEGSLPPVPPSAKELGKLLGMTEKTGSAPLPLGDPAVARNLERSRLMQVRFFLLDFVLYRELCVLADFLMNRSAGCGNVF